MSGGALERGCLDSSFLHIRVRVKGQDGQGQTLKGTSGGAEPREAVERGATDFSRCGGHFTPAWVSPELVLWGQEPWAVGQDTQATAGTPTQVLGPLASAPCWVCVPICPMRQTP